MNYLDEKETKEIKSLLVDKFNDIIMEYKVNHPEMETLEDKDILKIWAEDMCQKGLMKKVDENSYECINDEPDIIH